MNAAQRDSTARAEIKNCYYERHEDTGINKSQWPKQQVLCICTLTYQLIKSKAMYVMYIKYWELSNIFTYLTVGCAIPPVWIKVCTSGLIPIM